MVVQFLDDDHNPYEWSPSPNEVERIFLHSIDVEESSEPESGGLDAFASIVGRAADRGQGVENAETLKGYFEYDDQKLVLSLWGDKGEEQLISAFYVASGFFDKWLQDDAEAFVTKGYAVRVTRLNNNGRVIEVYPPRDSE